MTKMSRVWAMPNADTFSVKPIGDFVRRYSRGVCIDPFARNSWPEGEYTNDLNPNTSAKYHMDAVEFLKMLADAGVEADTIIFDPPYSPRQITECYQAAGLKATMQDTQSGRFKKLCREQIRRLSRPGTVVLSFGWNSVGMGPAFYTDEILLVSHGGDHNDTICMAQTMMAYDITEKTDEPLPVEGYSDCKTRP